MNTPFVVLVVSNVSKVFVFAMWALSPGGPEGSVLEIVCRVEHCRRLRLASCQSHVNKTARHGGFKYGDGVGRGRAAPPQCVWFPFDVIFAQTLLRIGFEIERRRVTNLAQHLISRTPMSASRSHAPPGPPPPGSSLQNFALIAKLNYMGIEH